jgi:hypothetical protein
MEQEITSANSTVYLRWAPEVEIYFFQFCQREHYQSQPKKEIKYLGLGLLLTLGSFDEINGIVD